MMDIRSEVRRAAQTIRTERRQTPRMKVEGLAYVTLDPDNGGVVSDISEGGLSFYSTSPVERTTKIRFWFSQRRYKIEGDARMACTRFLEADTELAWKDETARRGGLRFTNLAKEDREEIRAWIELHSASVPAQKQPPRSIPLSPESPFVTNARDAIAKPRLKPLNIAPAQPSAAERHRGFAGGLATGVLVSAIVGTAVFAHNHSREIGDSLIRLGERVGGKSRTEASSPAVKPASAETNTVPISGELTALRPPPEPAAPVEHRLPVADKHPSQASETAVKQRASKVISVPEAAPTTLPAAKVSVPASPAHPNPSTVLPSAPAVSPEITADNSVARQPVSEPAFVRQPDLHEESSKEAALGPPPEEYLEVGKYRDKQQADKTTDQLTQFGFPSVVVPKNLFWKKTYQVLVGPYSSDHQAEVAHTDLASHGFPARPFERGKRELTLHTALTLGQTGIPTGDCVIHWESYIPNTMVKIEGPGGVSVVLEGKLVNREEKYRQNSIVYIKNSDGTRTLKEFRFSGMEQALVFGTGDGSQRF